MPATRTRHRRDYFETAVEVAPPSLQAFAALAAALALAFAGHRFVAAPVVIAILVLSTSLLVSSSIWSWRARRLLLNRTARDQKKLAKWSDPDKRIWFYAAISISGVLLALGIYILVNGLRPSPSFYSPYDGIDPQTSPCLSSAVRISEVKEPSLLDASDQAVGRVELIRSADCSTVWGRVVLNNQGMIRAKNDTISITAIRPGDNITAPFSIALTGHSVAFGSMLSDAQSCVQVQVTLVSPHAKARGPVAVTACR
jgi:Protein of unknown function (DUF2690)